MRFKIGNRVAVLDDNISGKVSDIQGDVVVVIDDDGMLFRFASNELVCLDANRDKLLRSYHNDDFFLKQQHVQVKSNRHFFKKAKNEVVMEVDLHIDKLVGSTRGMDNFDMLSKQLDTAKHKIEYCISKKISKLVFIHGVGEGVLKSELHLLLGRYPVEFYPASFQKYGFGATEVYVFQNSN